VRTVLTSRRVAVDAPSATEWAEWWARPRPARAYNALLIIVAALLLTQLPRGGADLLALVGLVLAGMATVELGRVAEGGRVDRQRIHKGLSAWPFAAALVLGPGAAAWVAAALYSHALARGIRIRRWKWIGSWAIVSIAALAASATLRATTGGLLPDDASLQTVGGVLGGLAAFLAVEAGLFGIISRLNTPEDEVYLRAQLTSVAFYAVEASVLASGALAAVLWQSSPGFILLAGPAYLLMQRGLLHQPLRDEARHDAKTGVLHYSAWRTAALATMEQARRDRRRPAVLLIDVDHFKKVNDTYGHLVGDQVLAGAADAVLGCLRSTDVPGRFGGDEFCALVLVETLGEAAAAADRIRARIGSLVFDLPDLAVTASVGVALGRRGLDGADLDSLVAAGDAALYEAKAAGRNQVSARVAPAGWQAPAPGVTQTA
jgi:diguanylate cyclase (GGDEF)-like protein